MASTASAASAAGAFSSSSRLGGGVDGGGGSAKFRQELRAFLDYVQTQPKPKDGSVHGRVRFTRSAKQSKVGKLMELVRGSEPRQAVRTHPDIYLGDGPAGAGIAADERRGALQALLRAVLYVMNTGASHESPRVDSCLGVEYCYWASTEDDLNALLASIDVSEPAVELVLQDSDDYFRIFF